MQDDRVERARELRAAGRIEAAEREYRSAVADHDADAYVELGALLRKLERLSDAEALYQEAIEADIVDVLIPYANMLADVPGRECEAIALYRKALDAGDEFAHVNLAITLDELDRPSEAEAEFKNALQISDPLARRNYGIFLYRHGRYAEAEVMLKDAIQDGDRRAHVDLGNVFADTAREAAAEREYRSAIDAGAAVQTARRAYARLLRELGRFDESDAQMSLAEKELE